MSEAKTVNCSDCGATIILKEGAKPELLQGILICDKCAKNYDMKTKVEIREKLKFLRASLNVHVKTHFYDVAHDDQVRIAMLKWVLNEDQNGCHTVNQSGGKA